MVKDCVAGTPAAFSAAVSSRDVGQRNPQALPAFDLCLYNAGMDPYAGCPNGGLPGIDEAILAERERLVFTWCRAQRIPVAFVLAGGYVGGGFTATGLVALHRLTLAAAGGLRARAPPAR